MVGVAGRSKGCNTCKRRKIACTKERPICYQCIKSNRVCGGYQRQHVFVINNTSVEQAVKQSKKGAQEDPIACHAVVGAHETSGQTALEYLLDIVCSKAAYRQQLLSEGLYSGNDALEPSMVDATPWLTSIAKHANPTSLLEVSMCALATANLGRASGDKVMLHESLALYTRGLQELQRALYHPKLMYQDDTLAACMALSGYEAMECPEKNRDGFVSHIKGCVQLIKLRGPNAYQDELGHQSFRAVRQQAILQSMEHHSATFLSERAWLELPWADHPKTPYDRVFDALATAPGLLEAGDLLGKTAPSVAIPKAAMIYSRCLQVKADLVSFYDELERSSPGPLYWPHFSNYINEEDLSEHGKVFPIAFGFRDLETAATLTLYWAALSLVNSGLFDLRGFFAAVCTAQSSSPNGKAGDSLWDRQQNSASSEDSEITTPESPEPAQSSNLGLDAEALFLSDNICQSVEYCLGHNTPFSGPSTAVVPLKVAIGVYGARGKNERKFQWAVRALQRVESLGPRLLRFYDNESMSRHGLDKC